MGGSGCATNTAAALTTSCRQRPRHLPDQTSQVRQRRYQTTAVIKPGRRDWFTRLHSPIQLSNSQMSQRSATRILCGAGSAAVWCWRCPPLEESRGRGKGLKDPRGSMSRAIEACRLQALQVFGGSLGESPEQSRGQSPGQSAPDALRRTSPKDLWGDAYIPRIRVILKDSIFTILSRASILPASIRTRICHGRRCGSRC